jgi:DNA-binding transcriptional LysR family regulator
MALERKVGVPLLIRSRHGVELTSAGAVLLEHANRLLELADHAVERTRLVGSGRSGIVQVGVPASGVREPARSILETFSTRFPEAEVHLHPGLIAQNVAALETHTLDAAFVLAPFDWHHPVRYLPLGESELLVALPDGHRLASLERIPKAELLQETFLDWPMSINPPLVRHVRHLLFGEPGHPRSHEVLDVGETSRLLLVAAGQGVTLATPPDDAELMIPGITLRRLEEPAPWIQCGIAWPAGPLTPVGEAFLALAMEFAPAGPLHTAGVQVEHGQQAADVVHR